MSRARKAAELMLPWGALIGAAAGWFLAHLIGSSALFDHCDGATLALAVAVALAGIAVTIAGGFASLAVWRRQGESETRRFIALVAMLAGALLALATLLQAIAPLIIGSCAG